MCSQFRGRLGAEGRVEASLGGDELLARPSGTSAGGAEGRAQHAESELLAPPVGTFGHDGLDPGDLRQDSGQFVQGCLAVQMHRQFRDG